MERRLAAILAADVAGYSRLMEQDEAGTFERLRALRKGIFEPEIENHRGRIFKLMGDGLLAEFGSIVDAVQCAAALQRAMAEKNSDLPTNQRIDVRIGINLGDLIVEGEDRHGEGVNIASRLQAIADPGGICISQNAFDQVETKLDLSFEDLGNLQVKNIAKPVRVYRVSGEGIVSVRPRQRTPQKRLGLAAAAVVVLAAIVGAVLVFRPQPEEGFLPPLPSGPKVAILPFENISANPETERFANGLAQDIATALSRFSNLFVFPLNATMQFKGASIDPRQVGKELGAKYVIEGSVWRSNDRLRVTAQLLDTGNAKLLWSDTFDSNLAAKDIFTQLDAITERVVATIASSTGVIELNEAALAGQNRTGNFQAYDCVMLATLFLLNLDPDRRSQARACLEVAVKIDPNYSRAWSNLADVYVEIYKNERGGNSSSANFLELAENAARRAIDVDKSNQQAYYILAIISRLRGQSYEAFEALADKAIKINPNDSIVIGDIGNFTFYAGHWERGKALLERMMQLNPRYPSWAHFVFFLDYYRNSQYEDALKEGLLINLPQHCMVQWGMAAVYGELGDKEKGTATLDNIAKIDPPCPDDPRDPFVKRGLPKEVVESLMDGLKKAGATVPPAASSGG